MSAPAVLAPSSVGITASEFTERRRRVVALARDRGLKGLLVCARGGGALDRYGDVLYLTNYYSPFPFIPDVPGNWTLRGHPMLVLSATAETRLVIDCEDDGRIALAPSEIVRADLVVEATIRAMRELGLEAGSVGLVGGDVLPVNTFKVIELALPAVRWQDAQKLLSGLRAIKSPAEIALVRRASALGSRMIDAMMEAARPGVNHGDILAAGMDVLLPAGGIHYNSFLASGSGGDRPVYVASTFPTWAAPQRLESGQFFTAGISGALDGYYFDMARSTAVGPASNRQIDLFEAAIAAVEAGVAAVRPGVTAESVARAALERQQQMGFPLTSDFSGMGHGIGLGWDDPWLAPGDTTVLQPGMVLCVERTVSQDGYVGDFEQTVLVTETGSELLTDAVIRRW